MIHTSYFAKYRGNAGCSIALRHPKGYKGFTCEALYPPKSLLDWYNYHSNNIGEVFMTKKELHLAMAEQYNEHVLKRLDVKSVAEALDGKVLLCWEGSGKFCHRHLVSQWLRNHGYKCEELVYNSDLKGMSSRRKAK